MIKKCYCSIVLLLFFGVSIYSQNYQMADSILRVADQSASDSVKMICFSRLSEFYRGINPEKQLFYSNKTIYHANQIDNTYYALFGKSKRAVAIFEKGETENALNEMEKVLNEAILFNDSGLLASLYNQYGILFRQVSNYTKAMENFSKAIQIAENIGREYDAAGSYNNIAIIYNTQGDIDKALEYFNYAMNIYKKDVNKTNYAKLLVNTAIIYSNKKEYAKALELANEAMEIWVKLDKKVAIGETYACLADIYNGLGDNKNTFKYLNKSLEIRTSLNNTRGMAESYSSLGLFYFNRKQYDLAVQVLTKSIRMAEELSLLEILREAYNLLYAIYLEKMDYKLALENLNKYYIYKDSVFNISNIKSLEILKSQLDKEKNERELELANVKIKNSELELNKQKQKFIFSIGASVLLICIVILIIFQQIKSRRLNKILNEKNKLIEEKNKNITDSINYAKRIQNAVLPSLKNVNLLLPQNFVYYKPKDIVAGDFYWFEAISVITNEERVKQSVNNKKIASSDSLRSQNRNDVILFAAADCTGHGVPGAIVSVVCNNALNRTVREFGITEPGKILDKTREIVIQEFSKSDEDVKDGMDISLCKLENIGTEKYRLEWAGANNPLWVIRPTVIASSATTVIASEERTKQSTASEEITSLPTVARNDESGSVAHNEGNVVTSSSPKNKGVSRSDHNYELIEYKPNKQPIGKTDNPQLFNTHSIELEKGDTIYIFTDGFQDQFGGNNGKKLKAAKLKEIILSIQEISMEKQIEIIDNFFNSWKGNLEQVDDVCIIGVRV